jgi:mono/diheme cytochrome c family protein
MNLKIKCIAIFFSVVLMACGGKEEKKKDGIRLQQEKTETAVEAPSDTGTPASQRIELDNKGVGPITSVTLDAEIDEALAVKGKGVYEQMCLACHKPDKKYIGPAPKGVLERRSPEWVMNMILNPQGMVKEDPLAKDLLQEFNGAPMANQNLTEDQARAVLEYFRTL